MFIEKNENCKQLKKRVTVLVMYPFKGKKKKKRLWDFRMRTVSYLTDVSRKEGIYLVT